MRVAVVGLVGQSVFLPVKRLGKAGETVMADAIHTEPGGKGFNQAVAAARYGAEVAFLAAVGNDAYADTVQAYLKAEKIDAALCRKAAGTAYAAIVTDKDGNNCVTEYTGAQLTVKDVVAFGPKIAGADVLLLTNETPEAVNVAAAETAAANGVYVILNPAPYRPVSEKMLSLAGLLTPNEHETVGLDGRTNVVETLGGRGCRLRMTGETVPAFTVKAVDTTGAGDTFNGVLAAALAAGQPLPRAVRAANAAAGLSVTRRGAVGSIPHADEIENFLKQSGGCAPMRIG